MYQWHSICTAQMAERLSRNHQLPTASWGPRRRKTPAVSTITSSFKNPMLYGYEHKPLIRTAFDAIDEILASHPL